MLRLAAALFHYFAAFVFIYAATAIAPDMAWPSNDVENVAAALLVAGLASKLFGHIILLGALTRR